jgi:hypothetical protein
VSSAKQNHRFCFFSGKEDTDHGFFWHQLTSDSTRRVQSSGFVISEGTPQVSGPAKRRKVSDQPHETTAAANGQHKEQRQSLVALPPAFRESSSEEDEKPDEKPVKQTTPLPSSLENSPEPRPSVKRLTLPSRTPQALRSATRLTNGPKLTPATETPTRTAILRNQKQSLSPVKPAATPPKSVEKQNGVRASPRLQAKPRVSYSANGEVVSGGSPPDPQGPLRGERGAEGTGSSKEGTVEGDGERSVVEESLARGVDDAQLTPKPSNRSTKEGGSSVQKDDSEITPKPRDSNRSKKEGETKVQEDESEITPKPKPSNRSRKGGGSSVQKDDSEITPKPRDSGIRSNKKGVVQDDESEITPKPSGGTKSNRKANNVEVQEGDDSEITPKPRRGNTRSDINENAPRISRLQEDDSEITPRPSTSKTKSKQSDITSKSLASGMKSKSRTAVDDDSEIIPKPSKRTAIEEDKASEITPRSNKRTQEVMTSQSITPNRRIRSQLQDEVRSSPRLQSKSKVSYNEDDLGEQAQQSTIKPTKDHVSPPPEDTFEPEPESGPENEEQPVSKKPKTSTKKPQNPPSKTDTSITLNLQKVPVNSGGTKRVNAIDVVSQIVLEILGSAEEGLEAPWAINAFTQYSDLVDQRFCRLVDAIDVNNTLGKAVKRAETKRNNLRLELLQLRKQRTELALEMQRVRDDHQTDKTNINRLREISSFVDDLRGLKETTNNPSNTQPSESLLTEIVKLDPIINTHYGALERIKALSKRLNDIDNALG